MKPFSVLKFVLILTLLNCNSSEKESTKFEQVKKKVAEWIQKNAVYPTTYKSTSFESFEDAPEMLSIGDYYKITHTYKLNSIDNIPFENKHQFVLNKDLKVSIISFEETDYIAGVPPSVFDWAILFGEKFCDVDFNGHNCQYYMQKFNDYKNINGRMYKSFDYLGKDCFRFLLKSMSKYDKSGIQINRIIAATDKSTNNEYASKFGLNKDPILEDYPQTNFAVFQINDDKIERYASIFFDESDSKIKLKDKNSERTYSYLLDSFYISTECFTDNFK